MQPFGRYLKTEREKRGIRLEEIASSTKIHIHNLVLMEEDRWRELPQEPFIRGFISAYARYLGLDNKETLKLFSQYQTSPDSIATQNKEASSSATQAPETPLETPSDEKKEPRLRMGNFAQSNQLRTVLLGALFLLLVIFAIEKRGKESARSDTPVTTPPPTSVTDETRGSSPATIGEKTAVNTTEDPLATPQTTEPPPNTTPTTQEIPALQAVPPAPPTQASAPIAAASPEPAAPTTTAPKTVAPDEGHELAVQIKYRSWMKIVIDNEPPKESYIEEGAKVTFQAKEKIKLVLGNASGAVVTYNGEESKGSKYSGTIRYYIFPKGSRFPQDKRKKTEESSESGQEPTTETTSESSSENSEQ